MIVRFFRRLGNRSLFPKCSSKSLMSALSTIYISDGLFSDLFCESTQWIGHILNLLLSTFSFTFILRFLFLIFLSFVNCASEFEVDASASGFLMAGERLKAIGRIYHHVLYRLDLSWLAFLNFNLFVKCAPTAHHSILLIEHHVQYTFYIVLDLCISFTYHLYFGFRWPKLSLNFRQGTFLCLKFGWMMVCPWLVVF